MSEKKKNAPPPSLLDYLRDIRVIQAVAQVTFVLLLALILAFLWGNVFNALEVRRLLPNIGILTSPAGFDIGEAPEWYNPNLTYGQAFLVGIVNTLRVVSVGLILTTLLGVVIGVFLLSGNWLVRTISRAYVEVLRNTPLLVQIYFWYFIVIGAMPQYRDAPGFPSEGIYTIPIRVAVHLLMLFFLWWQSRSARYPSWLMVGGLAAMGTLELIPTLNSQLSSFLLVGIVAVLGIVLVFNKSYWRDFARGFFILIGAQLLISGVLASVLWVMKITPSAEFFIWQIDPLIYWTRRGLALPEIVFTSRTLGWLAFVAVGLALAIVLWWLAGHITETTGRPIPRAQVAFGAIVGFAMLGWVLAYQQPVPDNLIVEHEGQTQVVAYDAAFHQRLLTLEQEQQYARDALLVQLPVREARSSNFTRGTLISPEYTGLLLGLVVYTSAFIAEIVRAGIQAVPYGQIEAARALGLSGGQTLTRIILPQALRIIIPPLGNQYLNLAKNSSLAAAIAFADVYSVGQTMMNQSGQSVVGFTMIFLVYISMSLTIAFVMNIVNRRFQLVTR